MSSSVYSNMSGRMSQVHGWEKICETLYGGKHKLPWDEPQVLSSVRRKLPVDDDDDEGSYSLTWDTSSDGEDSQYDDDESFTEDEFSLEEEVTFAQESANGGGSHANLSFLHTLRQAASSPAAGQIPDDISLPDNNSVSGLSYVSKLSMQSDLQMMSDRGQRMMESLQEMDVAFRGDDTVTEVIPHPKETLDTLLEGTKYDDKTLTAEYWNEFFLPISAERVERFNSRAARLIAKGGSLKAFQDFHQRTELSLDACNNRGETLLHLACRANARTIVQYLLQQGASLQVRDKIGRSPLVELCWTKDPDLPLINLVLQKAPALLFVVDRRGFSPLQYVPRAGHREWNSYLEDKLKSKILMFAQYAVFSQTARELQSNQARLQKLLLERLSS